MENKLIAKPLATAIATQLISTPHPVTLEGQRNIFAALMPDETLLAYLRRNVTDFDKGDWIVSIGGVEVAPHLWAYVKPKEGQKIELIGRVGRTALFMIAIIVLSIWTAGMASALMAGAGGAFGLGAAGTFFALVGVAAIQYAGTLLINKVLGPKAQSNKQASGARPEAIYSLTNTSNQARPYQAPGILFGTVMVAPDVLSKPYSWFETNEQYLALHLSWGIGVNHYEDLYMGNTLLSSYVDDTQVWNSGFSGMPEDQIPLFGNVDTQDGAPLQDESGNLQTVARTTSINTTRIGWDFQYQAYDVNKKGAIIANGDLVTCQYRAVGSPTWLTAAQVSLRGNATKVYRRTVTVDLPAGQYETQCFRAGSQSTNSSAVCQINLSTLTSIQKDESTYTGIARTALQLRASSQLNGTPDQILSVAHSDPIPVWKGASTGWVIEETSNPGAHTLKYLRGYYDKNGKLIAGCGFSDDEIDIPALQAWMIFCADKGFKYDFFVTQDRSHRAMLDVLAQAGMAEYTDASGLCSVVWSAADQPVDAIVNMARVGANTFRVDYTLIGTADGIAVTYVNKTTQPWSDATLYIPSPVSGTTTITNPATVTLEGVSDEATAAMLGRYLMGQQIYQYKGISYDTSLEFLTYRRMSVIQLQHDLTKWGFGGTVVSATLDGADKLHLKLDYPVPAPSTGNAYIGLRIPGEASFRVFSVVPFVGTTDEIVLAETWPADAAVPGDSDGNPAFDTLWIYDFKQTPGLSCRVISMLPQAGLKGASITVVPESDEFWTYVETGTYLPPKSGALLPDRPVAAHLTLSEQNNIIGNVTTVNMTASFDISGAVGRVLIFSDRDVSGEMQQIAEVTSERSATWRVEESRSYTVTVRPYTLDGAAGVPVTGTFTPALPGQPPVNVDIFNVTDKGDGLRTYSWAFNSTTTVSPNLAGVQIRYVAGTVSSPDWDTGVDMAKDSQPNYFTSAFTTGEPGGGIWTFMVRTINTDGILSAGILVKSVTLTDSIDAIIQETNQALDQLNTDTTNLRTDVDTTIAQMQVLQGQVGDILQADQWSATKTYPQGDLVQYGGQLFRSLIDGNLNHPPVASTTDAYWAYIGNYASLGEAVGANSANIATVQNTVASQGGQITANSNAINLNTAAIGTKADVSALNSTNVTVTAQGNTITAQGQDIALLGAHNTGKTAFVLNQSTVYIDGTTSLSSYITGVQANNTAVNARVDSEQTARANGDTANANAITAVQAYSKPNANLLNNPTGANGWAGWGQDGTWAPVYGSNGEGWFFYSNNASPAAIYSTSFATAGNEQVYSLSADFFTGGLVGGALYCQIIWMDASGGYISQQGIPGVIPGVFWERRSAQVVAPTNARQMRVVFFVGGQTGNSVVAIRRIKLEGGNAATVYSDDYTIGNTASATTALTTRVTTAEGNITANANAITAVQLRMPSGTGLVATKASVDAVQSQINASWTLQLNVNGYVSGIVAQNTGTVSNLTILSDNFAVLPSSGTGSRMEWSNGNQRIYDAAGTLRVRMGVW